MLLVSIGLIGAAVVALVVGLLYVFMTWNFTHWRKRSVPGPQPSAFTGNYPNMFVMKQHMINDLEHIYRKYKTDYDAVGIFAGRAPQLMVLSPELAHRVFVTDFKHFHDNELSVTIDERYDYILANNPFFSTGQKWKERRADVTPGLTISRIKSVYPVTSEVCKKLSNYIQRQSRLPGGIEAKDLSLRFTSEVVTACVLGLSAESFSDNPTPILKNIKLLFTQDLLTTIYFVLVTIYKPLMKLVRLSLVPAKLERFFVDLMDTAIKARVEKHGSMPPTTDRADFLDYIIQLGKKRNLDVRDLTAHSMTFLLDGYETTATVLSHLLLLLSRDAAIQQKLRDEINAHWDSNSQSIDFDKINELPYLDACINESIRLFPPAFMSNKLCTERLELPNKSGPNFHVEVGDVVLVPHYCYMTDEDYFSDPQVFDPERFIEPNSAKTMKDRGVFMGFGDGPRICVGMRFALAQMKAAVAEIIQHFRIEVHEKTRKDNTLDPLNFIAKLKGDILINFEKI